MEPRHGNDEGGIVSERVYLRQPWSARVVGNRMAAIFRPSVVWQLSVRGRRTGRWHTVPVAVLDHDRERYLLAPRGETDWALNLRASGTGRLAKQGRVEEITVAEVQAGGGPRPLNGDPGRGAPGAAPRRARRRRAVPRAAGPGHSPVIPDPGTPAPGPGPPPGGSEPMSGSEVSATAQ